MLKHQNIKGTREPDMTKQPTLSLKLPQWEGEWKTEIYNEDGIMLCPNKTNKSITPLDYLKKLTQVACVIQCGGIWFTNGKFNVTWKLLQAVVQNPKPTIQGTCQIKLKPSDKGLGNTADEEEGETNEDETEAIGIVEDSDAEAETEQPSSVTETPTVFNTPVPVPEPVVAAAVVEPVPVATAPIKPVKKVVKKVSAK